MRSVVCIAVAVAALAACGESRRAPDNTKLFVSCLQQRGGEVITEPGQLRGYPSTDVERVASVEFPSVSYDSIDVVAPGDDSRRQALVFVEDVAARPAAMPGPAELLRQARRGGARGRALILMPPAKDPEDQIGRCESRAAPGQDYL